MDVFHLVGGTGSNRNTCWSRVCLAWMGEMQQGQLPGACEFPGGTNHSGAATFGGEPCWQSFSSWFYSSLLLPCYLSFLHTGASHHPNSFFPVAAAIEWFIEMGLSQCPPSCSQIADEANFSVHTSICEHQQSSILADLIVRSCNPNVFVNKIV